MPHPRQFSSRQEHRADRGLRRDQRIPGGLLAMLAKTIIQATLSDHPNYAAYRRSSNAQIESPRSARRSIWQSSSFRRSRCSARSSNGAAAGVNNAVIISFGLRGGGRRQRGDGRCGSWLGENRHAAFRSQWPKALLQSQPAGPATVWFSPTVDVKKPGRCRRGCDQAAGSVNRRPAAAIGLCIYHRAKALGVALSMGGQRRQ